MGRVLKRWKTAIVVSRKRFLVSLPGTFHSGFMWSYKMPGRETKNNFLLEKIAFFHLFMTLPIFCGGPHHISFLT